MALLLQTAADFALLLCAVAMILFVTASAWTFITFVDDLSIELTHVNEINRSNADQLEMKTKLVNMTQLYSDAKQLNHIIVA